MHNLIHPDVFKHYPNNYFVETGSNLGVGIQEAVDAGFPNIISIELSEELHNICKERFKSHRYVKLIHGDSSAILYDTILSIHEPITFWLDAHYCGGCHKDGEEILSAQDNPDPILKELRVILKHPIKTHTILIDNYLNFSHHKITQLLWEINPSYTLNLINGSRPHDIILARCE